MTRLFLVAGANRATAIRYAVIGSIVFVVDVGLFQALLVGKAPLAVATVLAYVVGIIVHFWLNKYRNFRSFTRPVFAQVRTYLAIQSLLLAVTLAITQGFASIAHFSPLAARGIAIIVNFPLGFLAHRYLTFSDGITATYRKVRASRASAAMCSGRSAFQTPGDENDAAS